MLNALRLSSNLVILKKKTTQVVGLTFFFDSVHYGFKQIDSYAGHIIYDSSSFSESVSQFRIGAVLSILHATFARQLSIVIHLYRAVSSRRSFCHLACYHTRKWL